MDKQQLSNLLHIQKASRENRLVVFVGAGVSANSGIPTWNELIHSMKKELPTGIFNEADPLKVAQLYKDSRGHKEYMDMVKESLLYNKIVPNDLHKSILALNPSHIITTNWDDLMEQEIANEFLQYDVIREDRDIPQITSPNVLVKMHGDFSKDNIVFTENDYFNYKDNFPLIRAYIQSLFASKLVLFVGFSFADLNLKIILNEVQNILSDKMQRAYLLSCDEPDYITRQYFEKKGLNVLYLSENDIDVINENKYVPESLQGIGKHTDKILYAIKNYSATSVEELAQYLYERVTPFMNELRSFGDGLRYFFPKDKNMYWNTHSHGLQTGLTYFKDLASNLKTDSSKRQFLIEHPDINIKTLLKFAFYNYLYEIDGLKIIDDKFLKNIERYIKMPVLYYIHRFNADEVCDALKKLRVRTVNYTIEDLELPYTLYNIGDYREAYHEYTKLLPLYWNKGKYILYFICRYNLWSIRHGVHYQLILDEEHDVSKEIELATKTELDVLLNKLPIDMEIKKIFNDLISFRTIGGHVVTTDDLQEQIFQHRKLSEKGGWSINSNIAKLMALYQRESLFSWGNFIVCDNNSYYRLICENHVKGILNSISTISKPINGNTPGCTRILSLDAFMLESLFFDISNKRLQEIIKNYEIGTLKIHSTGIEYINSCIDGLSKKEPSYYKEGNLLYDPLRNLVLIISKTKEKDISIEKLYNVIVKYQPHNYNLHFSHAVLEELIKNYPPSEKSAKSLINKLLESTFDYQEYASCIYNLVKILQDNQCTFNEIDFESFKTKESLATELSFLYPVVTDEIKVNIKEFSLMKIQNFHDYIFFIKKHCIYEQSPERFKELLEKKSFRELDDVDYYWIAQIRQNTNFESVHGIIDNLAIDNDCLKFYLSPFEYSRTDSVNIEWIFNFEEDIKSELFKNDVYKNKLKQFIVEHTLSTESKNYLMKFL